MIRVLLGERPAEKLRFWYSPLLESVFALEALVNPKRHPLQLRWVLDAKPRLPPDLWREVRALSFGYKTWCLGMFSPAPDDGIPTFPEELDRIRRLPISDLVADVARAFTPDEFEGFPTADQVLVDPGVQTMLALEARRLDPVYEPVARQLWTDPEAVRGRILSMLQAFWDGCFAQEWERVQPLLVEDVSAKGEMLRRNDLYQFFREILPGAKVSRRENTLLFRKEHEAVIHLDQYAELLLVPSHFTWAMTRVECDAPWTPCLVYPAGYPEQSLPALPPEMLAKVLTALAHETRLQILKLCAEAPRSTQELARLLGLTEGGVSRHIQQLEDAGLVAGRRRSYYMLYAAVPRRLRQLSPALVAYVDKRQER